MTAFAFILGCVPLLDASGAGGVSRRMLGIVVVCGMLAATLLGVFLTPALFVLVERLGGRKDHAPAPATTIADADAAHATDHAAE
jgi:HAE1 family hydrophobic/amphiphilic exporter-1